MARNTALADLNSEVAVLTTSLPRWRRTAKHITHAAHCRRGSAPIAARYRSFDW